MNYYYEFFEELKKSNEQLVTNFTNKELVHQFLDKMANFLFPVCRDDQIRTENLELKWEKLMIEFKRLLIIIKSHLTNKNIDGIMKDYFEIIPKIFRLLLKDAQAILDFDPASYSIEEIIAAYPGFRAILTYRLAHPLYQLRIPIIPRLMSEYAHSETGIDINPGAIIGESFFIDHGTGVVIGETTIIGNNVKIYQGVTLGALNVKKEEAKLKRHPTIEDNVIIYSGSTILGGNTVVGHDSIIGGNVWLTKSVDPSSVVYNKNKVMVRNDNIPELINADK